MTEGGSLESIGVSVLRKGLTWREKISCKSWGKEEKEPRIKIRGSVIVVEGPCNDMKHGSK